MVVILYIIVILLLSAVIICIAGMRYNNPFEINFIFGTPGSGKSTISCAEQYKHLHKGWSVYTDDSSSKVKGVKIYDSFALKEGHFNPRQFEQDENKKICLFVDEAGLVWPNREFRTNFTQETLDWWKKHRHYKVKVYMCSQGANDVDLKLREMTSNYYLVKRSKWFFPQFILVRRVFKTIDISKSITTDGDMIQEGGLSDIYKYGGFQIYYLPKWIKKFDSYRK